MSRTKEVGMGEDYEAHSMTMAESLEKDSMEDFYDQQTRNQIFGEPVDKNLKTLAASGKPKMSDVPPIALFALGAAMSNGKDKYGRFNWRSTGTTASVFYDAMQRHLAQWYSGQDFAEDSKIHHLAHIMASCAILLDSEFQGSFVDDRDHAANDKPIDPPFFWVNKE